MIQSILRNVSLAFGSLSLATLAYLFYVKRSYNYLRSIGYDGPDPKFFIGNLGDFLSEKNSIKHTKETNKKEPIAISHYSKTLRRWTKSYGKIYGYYEGHSPVLVLADPDLVSEVFLDQNKLVSFRRSFPGSKKSSDPNSDIFTSNGIKWLRMRYGLEKVMLNHKNIVRCLNYLNESFNQVFMKNSKVTSSNKPIDMYQHAKWLMIQTMFSVVFGTTLNEFITQEPKLELKVAKKKKKVTFETKSDLYHTQIVAHKFHDAFLDYESFSLLKFFSITLPELSFLWRSLTKTKQIINSTIYPFEYLADPMDWFFDSFIQKYLYLYTRSSSNGSSNQATRRANRLQSQSTALSVNKFGYFNSFLYLTFHPIIKYHQNESVGNYRKPKNILKDSKSLNEKRKRALTTSSNNNSHSPTLKVNPQPVAIDPKRRRSLDTGMADEFRQRKFSTEQWLYSQNRVTNQRDNNHHVTILTEIDSEDFENWKFTINEAISNSLLMFFAGYETTSSAIAFCCHVLTMLPDERDKLIDELKENWSELKSFLDDDKKPASTEDNEFNDDVFEDDVFIDEDPHSPRHTDPDNRWHMIIEIIERMKYLDMFVKEVLRMFPIANSMVSRKCAVNDMRLDAGSGNYYVPSGMNIVVDVLSLHYDPVLWGPVDPELFYPERFLTERNPAAWLAFGLGCRKCLGAKLAMSQIKLFLVRLLSAFVIERCDTNGSTSQQQDTKLADTIETKDILFCGPKEAIQVAMKLV